MRACVRPQEGGSGGGCGLTVRLSAASVTLGLRHPFVLPSLSLLLASHIPMSLGTVCPGPPTINPARAVPVTASASSVRADKLTEATAGSRLTTSAKVLVSSFLGKVGKVPAKANIEVLDTGAVLTS